MAVIEITTRVGCRVMCSYCPQDRILGSYPDLRNSGHLMSFEAFERCLARIPVPVNIHFSGFTEPWLNPDCTRMVVAAGSRGHVVKVFSTLAGMTLTDVEQLEAARIDAFVIHLPADDDSMRLEVDSAYLAVLERLVHGKLPVRPKFHGSRMHPRVAEVVGESHRAPLHTRAGNVDVEGASPPRRLRGELACRRDPVQHVLLPNGDVVLCCMDWSLQHVLGNLVEDDYETITSGPEMQRVLAGWADESADILCRTCDKRAVSVDWKAKLYNRRLPRWKRRLGIS